MKIKKYSYSKINSFNSCPLRYRFTYIDKIKKKDEGIEALLGKVIHRCLEWIYRYKIDNGRSYFSLDQIINKYREFMHESWHEHVRVSQFTRHKKNDFLNAGMNWLVKYYNSYGPKFNQNVIDVEKKISFRLEGYLFEGIIDRIDKSDSDTIKIIDYKTGKKNISEKKLQSDLQMGVYYLAIQSIFTDKNIILSHLYIRNTKEVSVYISNKKKKENSKIYKEIYLNDTKKNILTNINLLESSEHKNDFKAKESNLCNWCYYWKECDKKTINNPSEYLE